MSSIAPFRNHFVVIVAAPCITQSATAEHFSRSHDAVIRVYDAAGNVIETHEHTGHFKEW
jgi:hypothetical protein